ncbi:hypothetical protein PTNB73_04562 [Pyrenophora teres f. teres]|nr:hypothetical protein HRS9139_04703 [Pyrenophora teres f. teres]KAE8840156.1 hypothetical protein HRS9122_06761 [Pyrenophora teres f. teres]KAE8869509.1 hypothetical protein PTNB73_04562 [Pyrenophora teres f. teres]
MTPRTRSGNGEAEPKVYYSKKVPQQVHFPHKRKTVRRRTSSVRDGSGKRQLVFVPEKMKKQGTPRVIGDSDEESEGLDGGLEDGHVSLSPQADEEHGTTRKRNKTANKRGREMMQEDDSEDDELVEPRNKHQRKAAPPKNKRRSRRVQADSNDDSDGSIKPDRQRMLIRQSTMTQLVEGRKPLPGSEGPDFRPVKQGPRLSWSGRGKTTKDGKQRTLTQMVPGMRPLEIMSDEDVGDTLSDIEAQEADSHTYRDAVARRLAQQGLYRNDHGGDEEARENIQSSVKKEVQENEEVADSQDVPELVVQSVEDDTDGEGEDSYKPTQFIDAPITTATRRTTRQRAVAPVTNTGETSYVQQKAVGSRKARFSLLSTPEKRRVREIPSSQSPADSPLSTQFTPHRLHRSPLKRCTGNEIQAPETPSKRKQVTFKMPSKTPVPPPSLRKFESTIQDSEDEDDGVIEEDALSSGCSVGADTQAVLDQIDQACAVAGKNGETEAETGSSQELDDSTVLRSLNEASPELGEPQTQSSGRQQRTVPDEDSHPYAGSTSIKQEPVEDVDGDDLVALPAAQSQPPHKGSMGSSATISAEAELPTVTEQLHSTPPIVQDTCPSTPMAIPEDSSDEEATPHPSKQPTQHRPSTQIQQSTDLDGELIQVPRSPTPQRSETQESHTSKAEQQLQNEWFSYSQYVHDARHPQSASMQVAPDAFSYNATPRPPPTTVSNPHQYARRHPATATHAASQATTIDEITQRTPRKTNSTQHLSSTHTTPHRIANSQPTISPVRPPPLFIPSSFPSPERAGVDGWSSPVLGGATQGVGGGGYDRSSQWGASLEDFSIPLPPPMPVVERSSGGRGNGKARKGTKRGRDCHGDGCGEPGCESCTFDWDDL